jgi:hypothetical protein
MGVNQSIKDLNSSLFVRSGRRRLIISLSMAAVVIATAGRINMRAQPNTQIPLRLYMHMPPDLRAEMASVIPTPQYVPAGYVLLGAYTRQSDGFGTGESEVRIQYLNPRYIRKVFSPLTIFVSLMTDNRLGGTAGQEPELISLRIGNAAVEAQYFSSIWVESAHGGKTLTYQRRGQGETSHLNALVFPFAGFMIGIRGNKAGGIDRSELIKIASSLTYPTG